MNSILLTRSEEQLKHHYTVEKELADRLRNATKKERAKLYPQVYNEIFHRVPDHSALARQFSVAEEKHRLKSQMGFLKSYLSSKQLTFIEVGAGDCHLCFEIAELVKKVYAIEVSETISDNKFVPNNFELLITDGHTIPLPNQVADVIYSNQVMEHLHPDDAFQQLAEIHRILKPKGVYLCVTPSRLNGPHDISQYFTETPTGFHLKEYTISELTRIFKANGFSSVKVHVGGNGYYLPALPTLPFEILEQLLWKMPRKIRLAISKTFLFRILLNVRVAGYK